MYVVSNGCSRVVKYPREMIAWYRAHRYRNEIRARSINFERLIRGLGTLSLHASHRRDSIPLTKYVDFRYSREMEEAHLPHVNAPLEIVENFVHELGQGETLCDMEIFF